MEDNSWLEQGGNIEWKGKRGGFWVKATAVYFTDDQICFLHHDYKPNKMEVFNFCDVDIRPIKSDREKAIEAAINSVSGHQLDDRASFAKLLAATWYDAGLLHLPEGK